MLRSFRVANHRSIRAEQELALMPVRTSRYAIVPADCSAAVITC